MNSPSLSPGRQAYLLAVRRQKRQVRLWQAALLAGLLALWELSCRVACPTAFSSAVPAAWPPPSSPFAAAATCGGT